LLVGRDILLPFRSRYGLTRYQHSAIERFHAFSPDLSAPVLEIGSDLEGSVLKALANRGTRQLIGLNVEVAFLAPDAREKGTERYQMIQGDVRHLPFEDGSIASIISIMAFEHIHDFDRALGEMYRVLKPGGTVYSDFGPIWSCSIGHHVYAIVDGVEARHWKPGRNPVPHFAHLLMGPSELRAALCQKDWVFPKLADAIVHWIYEGQGVNRMFYEDYVTLFDRSRFNVRHLVPANEHVPKDVQKRLESAYPGHAHFSARMVEVVLQKPIDARPGALTLIGV
jgi:ubiquinone/menaquinone biosynthesis C-methylase UbiE